MKLKKTILIIVVLSIVTISFFVLDKNMMKEVYNHDALYEQYDKLEDFEKEISLIIKGKKVGNPTTKTTNQDEFSDTWVYTDVKINKILKNTTNKEIKIGDIITVREPIQIVENKIGKTKVFYGDYTEIQKNTKYTLMINWNERGDNFDIAGLEQGKYNIDGKDKKEQEKYKENKKYKNLKEQVKNKHINKK